MSHPGHVTTRIKMVPTPCDGADPVPAIEEVLVRNCTSMTIQEIWTALNRRWAMPCISYALRRDARFACIGPRRFVLRTPGVIEYRGLVDEMYEIVHGEFAVRIEDLVSRLGAAFGVPEQQVRDEAWQRPFVCNAGWVMIANGHFAPSLQSLSSEDVQCLVPLRDGYSLDVYIEPTHIDSRRLEIDPVAAALLGMCEETEIGLPVVSTDGCEPSHEVTFWWEGGSMYITLPESFAASRALRVDDVLRLRFRGTPGRIRSVSLHILPAEVAIEQRILHQRVPQDPVYRTGISEHLEGIVTELTHNARKHVSAVATEQVRMAIEALMRVSREQVVTGAASATAPRARASQPGYGRITLTVSGDSSVHDPFIRWQWDEHGAMRLEFGLPRDPVREGTSIGRMLEKMHFAHMQDGPLFLYGKIISPGVADPVAMALLAARILRDVIRATGTSRWFVGPGDLAERAWAEPAADVPRWVSSTPLRQAVRDGFAILDCLSVPQWLQPWIVEPKLEEKPLRKVSAKAPMGGRAARPKPSHVVGVVQAARPETREENTRDTQ